LWTPNENACNLVWAIGFAGCIGLLVGSRSSNVDYEVWALPLEEDSHHLTVIHCLLCRYPHSLARNKNACQPQSSNFQVSVSYSQIEVPNEHKPLWRRVIAVNYTVFFLFEVTGAFKKVKNLINKSLALKEAAKVHDLPSSQADESQ
jgi:hypothetical protein